MFKIKREMNLTITKPYYTPKKSNDVLTLVLYLLSSYDFRHINDINKFDRNKPSGINLYSKTEFDRIVNQYYYIDYKKMI